MPTPNSLAALKALLAGSPDLNAADPAGLVQGRLNQESQAEDDIHRYQNAQSDPRHLSFSGASPSTFHDLARVLGESPNFGEGAEAKVASTKLANERAMQAGFTGDSEIAGPVTDPSHQLGEQLYANVNRSPLSPAAQAGQSASHMESLKTQMPLLAAREKSQGDILSEQEKGRQARQTGQAEFERTSNFLRPQTPPAPSAQPAPQGASAPVTPGGGGNPPQTSQSWGQYVAGGGPRPENDLMSSLKAMAERAKYPFMSTPLAPMIQNQSFGNLEQLQAQFPGVRGFQYLLPKLAEHQANFGKGETPDASYNRLHEMIGILGQVEQELGDPASHAKMGAHGQLEMTTTPAAIQRAVAAARDTRTRFEKAKELMKAQFPNLQDPISTQASPQPGGGRFQRIPE